MQSKAAHREASVPAVTFALDPVPPFRLDLTVWTLRRRPDNLMDHWDGQNQTYRRVLSLGNTAYETVEMAVTQIGPPDTPRLRVTLNGVGVATGAAEAEQVARATLTRTLGLAVDLDAFYRFAAADARLGPLVGRFRGVKPPRLPSVFETRRWPMLSPASRLRSRRAFDCSTGSRSAMAQRSPRLPPRPAPLLPVPRPRPPPWPMRSLMHFRAHKTWLVLIRSN